MSRNARTWLLFALAAAVLLGAMAFLTRRMIDIERNRATWANLHAREAALRIVLWRMDTALAPIIARENARPASAYFDSVAPNAPAQQKRAATTIPLEPFVKMHFQFTPAGGLSALSPDAAGPLKDFIANNLANHREMLAFVPPPDGPFKPVLHIGGEFVTPPYPAATRPSTPAPDQQVQRELATNTIPTSEFSQRKQATAEFVQSSKGFNQRNEAADMRVAEGVMVAWSDGKELMLLRRVRRYDGDYLQGCWLDWQAIRAWIEPLGKDQFREIGMGLLHRTATDSSAEPTMLAVIPATVHGQGYLHDQPWDSRPLHTNLAAAWACVVAAIIAAGLLLRGALVLSERRAAFVSAVTHEMRTPLTTFRLYTDLLQSGRVREEAARREYITTLRDEAERLSHMVENVLAQAQIERGRTRAPIEPVTLGALVERVTDRLRRRTQRANMELIVESRDEAAATVVLADPVSVEQILLNLVDNACKYAASATDRRVHLEADVFGGVAMLRVRDHGPGIDRALQRSLFTPFAKSARRAAETAPGIGLGLSLSRRLARAMGGELTLDRTITPPGAAFVVTLRRPA